MTEGTCSPISKNRRGKPVSASQKLMIINLYKDTKAKEPALTYTNIVTRVAAGSGIGKCTIQKTLAEYKRTGKVTSPNRKRMKPDTTDTLTESEKAAIRSTVHGIWMKKEIPNLKKVVAAVGQNAELPTFPKTTLWRILKKIGFRFKVRSRNSMLLDERHIIAWRQRYIAKIRKFRKEGRPIYFIDETWINAGDCIKQSSVDTKIQNSKDAEQRRLSTGIPNPKGRGKGLIVLHIGSEDGFLPGGLLVIEAKNRMKEYHKGVSGETFFEWFQNVEPDLKDNAVIIMDNAPNHSTKLESRPTMSWSKKAIKEWLMEKDYVIPDNFVKATLMELARETPIQDSYVIDSYADQKGKTILRLPPYHGGLNPMGMAWAMVKSHIKGNNREYNLPDVKQLLEEGIEKVTQDNWRNFIRHTTEMENKLDKMDSFIEEVNGEDNTETSDEDNR